MNLVLNTLQVSSCIPVSAEEITSYILHKNPHRQLDQDSDEEEDLVPPPDSRNGAGLTGKGGHSLKSPTNGGGRALASSRSRASPSPQRRAERAAMRSLRGHRQYIILDCRPREEFDACRLAPALHLDPELMISPEKLDAKLKEFLPLQVERGWGCGVVWWRMWTRRMYSSGSLVRCAVLCRALSAPSVKQGVILLLDDCEVDEQHRCRFLCFGTPDHSRCPVPAFADPSPAALIYHTAPTREPHCSRR